MDKSIYSPQMAMDYCHYQVHLVYGRNILQYRAKHSFVSLARYLIWLALQISLC